VTKQLLLKRIQPERFGVETPMGLGLTAKAVGGLSVTIDRTGVPATDGTFGIGDEQVPLFRLDPLEQLLRPKIPDTDPHAAARDQRQPPVEQLHHGFFECSFHMNVPDFEL